MIAHRILPALFVLAVSVGGAAAQTEEAHVEDFDFSFEGPFGTFDQQQLQRGLKIYTQVCSACHGLKFVPIRTLSSEEGPGLPEDQVRAYAENFQVADESTDEVGDMRPAKPSDRFPAVTSQGAPDLSLMAKKRAGFHGPYGLGINQLVKGTGGPEHIASILTSYTGETKTQAGSTLYENTAFEGGWIAMPPPLAGDDVSFATDAPTSQRALAKDAAAFLMWTAEPKMMQRRQAGLLGMGFLAILAVLLFLTNRRIWAPIKHPGSDA